MAPYSFAAAAGALISALAYFALYFGNDGSAVSGLIERALMSFGVAWLALVSWRLWVLAEA